MYNRYRYLNANWARMTDLFNLIDEDKDGKITRDELQNGLKLIHVNLSDEALDAIYTKLDKNGSGEIDVTEFIRELKTKMLETQNRRGSTRLTKEARQSLGLIASGDDTVQASVSISTTTTMKSKPSQANGNRDGGRGLGEGRGAGKGRVMGKTVSVAE